MPDKQWPFGDESYGQELECDPILGCQPISRSAIERMMKPTSEAWHKAAEAAVKLIDSAIEQAGPNA